MCVTLQQINDQKKAGKVPRMSEELLAWYDLHARALPWRAPAGQQQDPYFVWLSEIMLQQTTVAAVGRYFEAFIGRWPTIKALADAELDDILREWAGLGYYARARNLHACAQTITVDYGANFPDTEAGLAALPGIGPYTAAAIAAIAFNRPAAAVDANVERVISRVFAISDPLPGSKPEIKQRTAALVPEHRPGDFAQALMDLGATICTPGKPNCRICPWRDHCKARELSIAETLPVKAPKKHRPTRRARVFWVERSDGAVLMRRRPDKGLLGGMLEFPSTGWDTGHVADADPPYCSDWQMTGKRAEHTFTHFHLVLDVMTSLEVFDAAPGHGEGWRWIAPYDLAGEALPTAMKKVATAVLGPDALKKVR